MTAAQALRAERAKERKAAYLAKAPERLKAAEERRKARAAKRLNVSKVKRTSALPDTRWLSRKRRRKIALASRRRNRASR